MLPEKKMQDMIGTILLLGTLFSTVLVLIGGIMYLARYGSQPMPFESLRSDAYPISIHQLWQIALSFSAVGLIELGLLLLVATQLLRVLLVTGLFIKLKDTAFSLISLFIFMVLVYSFIWRN